MEYNSGEGRRSAVFVSATCYALKENITIFRKSI